MSWSLRLYSLSDRCCGIYANDSSTYILISSWKDIFLFVGDLGNADEDCLNISEYSSSLKQFKGTQGGLRSGVAYIGSPCAYASDIFTC